MQQASVNEAQSLGSKALHTLRAGGLATGLEGAQSINQKWGILFASNPTTEEMHNHFAAIEDEARLKVFCGGFSEGF